MIKKQFNNEPNPYKQFIEYGTKTVQDIKLSVRAPEPSYSERGMGVARHRWLGALCFQRERHIKRFRLCQTKKIYLKRSNLLKLK